PYHRAEGCWKHYLSKPCIPCPVCGKPTSADPGRYKKYATLNSRSTANTLEEETDFNDFLDKYKKIIGSNKKMGISVILN
ncbi:9471_t:CDS:2, partial [Diversispora eburnea]